MNKNLTVCFLDTLGFSSSWIKYHETMLKNYLKIFPYIKT